MAEPSVVRRCNRCGRAAMVSSRAWKEIALLGVVHTGRVRREDFVCQGCGAFYTWKAMRIRWLVAFMMGLPTIGFAGLAVVGGIIAGLAEGAWLGVPLGLLLAPVGGLLLAWALLPWWDERRHPVVPGAPMPEIRYRITEPFRRCSCGLPAPCTQVVRSRLALSYTHACASCGRDFVVTNLLGSVSTGLASLVALGLGVAMMSTASGQGAGAWVCSGCVLALGLGGLALMAARLIARVRHPIFPAVPG